MKKTACASALATGAIVIYLCVPATISAQSISAQSGSAQRGGKMEIPVQKSGKVVMADGASLPEPVDVEAFCGGSVGRPIARTDSRGGFVVGSGRAGQSDARFRSGDTAQVRLAGCALQARLPGYQSSSLRVVDDGVFDLGTIVLSRRAGVEGSNFSGTALNAPKDARRDFDKARQAIEKKKPDQAKPLLEKVVKDYPQHAAAWFELGTIHQAAKDLPQARNAFEQAIQADPKYIPPYLSLAAVYNTERNWKGTADMSAEVIRLDPFDYPAAYALLAMSNFRVGNHAAAETSCKKVLEMGAEATFPEAEYMLGMIMGARGDTKGGAEHLANFLRLAPNWPGADAVKKQLAEWEQPAPPK